VGGGKGSAGGAPERSKPLGEYKAERWVVEAGERADGEKPTVHLVVVRPWGGPLAEPSLGPWLAAACRHCVFTDTLTVCCLSPTFSADS